MNKPNTEKLQKVLARSGYGARREIEEWIAAGQVKVNDEIAKLGDRITVHDRVRLNGKLIDLKYPKHQRVLMYHKPEGVICTNADPEGRTTVFEKLPKLSSGRWVMIGRLDINSSGLILFTNDGELANQLMHPRQQIEREYAVRVLGEVTPAMLANLKQGVQLDDGMARFSDIQRVGGSGANVWYQVTLCEGRNREVRRLWASQDIQVSRLIRIRYGNVMLPRALHLGQYLELESSLVTELVDLAANGGKVSLNRNKGARPVKQHSSVRVWHPQMEMAEDATPHRQTSAKHHGLRKTAIAREKGDRYQIREARSTRTSPPNFRGEFSPEKRGRTSMDGPRSQSKRFSHSTEKTPATSTYPAKRFTRSSTSGPARFSDQSKISKAQSSGKVWHAARDVAEEGGRRRQPVTRHHGLRQTKQAVDEHDENQNRVQRPKRASYKNFPDDRPLSQRGKTSGARLRSQSNSFPRSNEQKPGSSNNSFKRFGASTSEDTRISERVGIRKAASSRRGWQTNDTAPRRSPAANPQRLSKTRLRSDERGEDQKRVDRPQRNSSQKFRGERPLAQRGKTSGARLRSQSKSFARSNEQKPGSSNNSFKRFGASTSEDTRISERVGIRKAASSRRGWQTNDTAPRRSPAANPQRLSKTRLRSDERGEDQKRVDRPQRNSSQKFRGERPLAQRGKTSGAGLRSQSKSFARLGEKTHPTKTKRSPKSLASSSPDIHSAKGSKVREGGSTSRFSKSKAKVRKD